jgi:hypothetical protein
MIVLAKDQKLKIQALEDQVALLKHKESVNFLKIQQAETISPSKAMRDSVISGT